MSNLELVFVRDLLQFAHSALGEQRERNVDWGPDGRPEVGRAEGQPAQPLALWELHERLDGLDARSQPGVDLAHVSTLLHADDPQVVLLPHPHQKGLLLVVEDPSACGPEAAGVGRLKESVTFFEQKVVADQLILDLLGHA